MTPTEHSQDWRNVLASIANEIESLEDFQNQYWSVHGALRQAHRHIERAIDELAVFEAVKAGVA